MPLDAGAPHPWAEGPLAGPMLERLFGGVLIVNKTSARLCQAGLWLLANHLDECHAIAQSVGTQDGSYWHALVHRREGDYENSAYWFRHAGNHPIHPTLLEGARSIASNSAAFAALVGAPAWSPGEFAVICRSASSTERADSCRSIQQLEWDLLFAYCYRKATEED